jgi:sugar lactone lactonase YvrE
MKIKSMVQLGALCTVTFGLHYKTVAQQFPSLKLIAESQYQWTGIAISKKDKMFVNFPRWSQETPVSVGEIINGEVQPFPDSDWNNWPKDSPTKAFVCVQSIIFDDRDRLWVLDTGYDLKTDSATNAHLYVFDIHKRALLKEYKFPNDIVHGSSYLNDFRIDRKKNVVYLTDSGLGGIVILDLKTEKVKRVLGEHPSTLTERDQIVVEGRTRKHPVHSDGIELDSKNGYLYYCALMGKNIYRIRTDVLLDKKPKEIERGKSVEKFVQSGANDGIFFDRNGNLFLSSLERNAISVVGPDRTLIEHIPRPERGPYKIYRLEHMKLKSVAH